MARKTGKKRNEIKIHSLGYMMEKFKDNLPNPEYRRVLVGTSFCIVGSTYAPPETVDDRLSRIGEMIMYSTSIEQTIDRVARMRQKRSVDEVGMILVMQAIGDCRTAIRRYTENPNSNFYLHVREYLEQLTTESSDQLYNGAREVGRAIRTAVRPEFPVGDEKKIYVTKLSKIDYRHSLIRTIEREYDKVRDALLRTKHG